MEGIMYPCEIKELPTQAALSIRSKVPVEQLPEFFEKVYSRIGQYLFELDEQHMGAAFAIYYNLDMKNLDVEAGFTVTKPVAGKGDIRLIVIPGGTYAVCHYTGPYNQMTPAYDYLREYAEDRHYKVGQIAYEWYLNGPEVPPQQLRTDIAFPVTHVEKPEYA
jgi:effector-binding domain-containing protein